MELGAHLEGYFGGWEFGTDVLRRTEGLFWWLLHALPRSDLGIKKLVRRPIKGLAVPAAAYGKGAPQRSYRETDSHPVAWDGYQRNGLFGRDANRDVEPTR